MKAAKLGDGTTNTSSSVPVAVSGIFAGVAIGGGSFNEFLLAVIPPPIAKCQNVTVFTGPGATSCTASASIDNGSSDPNGDPITLTQSPASPYPLGKTPVTLTVADTFGVTATCGATVTVVDNTPPVVTSSVATPLLWPPDHSLQNVGLTASATDICDAHPVVAVQGVFSTEPDQGPGADFNFSPDAKDIGIGTLRLRSERPGNSNRVYLNIVIATDSSGNKAYSCNTVVVPLGMDAGAVAAVNAAAAAQQAYCASPNGTPPVGDFPNGVGPVVGPKQ